jgi:hypothetical protein
MEEAFLQSRGERRLPGGPPLFDRRSFLASGAAVLASALLPRISSATDLTQTDWFSPAENAIRQRRVLTEPLLLGRGESMLDTDYIVPADFRKTEAVHAITAHPTGVTIRNCRILFETDVWKPEWAWPLYQQPWGINPGVSGLCLAGTQYADIDGLHVEGAPRCGIDGWDVSNLRIRRFSATRCHVGAYFGERAGIATRILGNRQWDVADVRIWDTWGGPSGFTSRVRPGGWVGGDCWVSEGDRAVFRRMQFSGEMYIGAKICRGGLVLMEDITTPSIMFQGSSACDPALEGLSRLYVKRLYLNAATGYGVGAESANKVQISFNVVGSFEGGYIIGNGKDGNAIQVTGNCHLDMRGLTIGGFNGKRSSTSACALDLDERPPPWLSTINSDFESVNTFFNQNRRLRRVG